MKRSKIVICILTLIFCIIASAVSAAAISAPRVSILALSLTLDFVLVVSLCAIIAAAVCIGLKLYKKNQKSHK